MLCSIGLSGAFGSGPRCGSFHWRRMASGLAVVVLFAALVPRTAHAAIDAVDVAVEAGATGGMFVGLNIDATQKTFIKGVVRCLVDGKTAGECGKEAAIAVMMKDVPAEARNFTNCIAGGGRLDSCATKEVVDRLPAEAKPIAGCIVQTGDVAGCAQKAAMNQIGGVLTSAQKEALDNLRKLGVDTANAATDKLPDFVQNVIKVAEGVRDGNYRKIVEYGGTEVVKAAMNIILEIILTPAMAPIIAPIVNTVIQNRVDLMDNLIKAAIRGDAVEAGKLAMEFYATTFIEAPCSIIPDGDFNDAVCGNLAKAIGFAGDVAAGVAKFTLDVLKDVLSAVGVWQVGDAIYDGIKELFDGKDPPESCGSTNAWFAGHYLTCLQAGADSNNGQPVTQPLFNACLAQFDRCYKSAGGQVCRPMENAFIKLSNQLNSAFVQGANGFAATTMLAFAASHGKDAACDRNFWNDPSTVNDFAGQCEAALRRTTKVSNDHCGAPTSPMSSAARRACVAAYQQVDKQAITKQICVISPQTKFRECNQPQFGRKSILDESCAPPIVVLGTGTRVAGDRDASIGRSMAVSPGQNMHLPGLENSRVHDVLHPLEPITSRKFANIIVRNTGLTLTGGPNLAKLSPGVANAMANVPPSLAKVALSTPGIFAPLSRGGSYPSYAPEQKSPPPIRRTNFPRSKSASKPTSGSYSSKDVPATVTRRAMMPNVGVAAPSGGTNAAMDRLTGDGRLPSSPLLNRPGVDFTDTNKPRYGAARPGNAVTGGPSKVYPGGSSGTKVGGPAGGPSSSYPGGVGVPRPATSSPPGGGNTINYGGSGASRSPSTWRQPN